MEDQATGRDVIALDTSCVVALVCGWHEHHELTRALLERRLDDGVAMALPAPVLIEAYSVLTRLPPPHRMASADALSLLKDNFLGAARIVAMAAHEQWTVLTWLDRHSVRGGHSYDGVIAMCARKAGAAELITLNLRHFQPFADERMRVTSPVAE